MFTGQKKKHGIINYHDTDRVRYHAFLLWLLDNMHPVFANQQQAEDFAKAREWPRGLIMRVLSFFILSLLMQAVMPSLTGN